MAGLSVGAWRRIVTGTDKSLKRGPPRARGVARTPVRPATLADLGTLALHRRFMWEEIADFDEAALDEADRAYRRWLRPRLRAGTLAGFVAERRGEPVASGCVWLQPIQPRPLAPERQPYVLSMWTEPDARGRGLARRIVQACVAWSRARGYASVALHAAPLGRGVYEGLGFERTWEMRLKLNHRSSRASTRR